jgi:hypothetical protein
MRWLVLGMILVTALVIVLAILVATSGGDKKRERVPRVRSPEAGWVMPVRG